MCELANMNDSLQTSIMLEGLRVSFGVATRLQRSSPDQPMMYQDWVIPPGVS